MEQVIIYKGTNRKRLTLSKYDFELLKFIYKERFLTEKQLYTYYTTLFSQKISYPGFWKKLSKFEEYGLLKSYKYRVGQNGTIVKYFRIREKSLSLLLEQKSLDETCITDIITTPPKNLDHYIGTKETLVKSIIELYSKRYEINQVLSGRVSQTKVFPAVVPDGFLKSGTINLYVEFDTGSETLKELKAKIRNYIINSDRTLFPNEGIVLSLLDNSIPNKKGIEDRSKRIFNLYQAITSLPEFHRTWVDIYILPLKIVQKASVEFFSETPITIREKVTDFTEFLLSNKLLSKINVQLPEDFYIRCKNHFGLLIEDLLIHDQTNYCKFATVFLYMQPGNIRSNFNLKRIITLQLNSEIKTEVVYAIYRDRDSMEEDVHLFGAIKNVRYISLEDIKSNYQESPYVYVISSKNSLRKVYTIEEWPTLF